MPTVSPVYTPTLSGRDEIAEGTMAFHITKPADFQFRAGQSIDLTLIDPPETDAEGNTRAFSLASAPFENELMIATRMRDTAFKRVLRSGSLGMNLKVEGPSGSFVLHRKVEKRRSSWPAELGLHPSSASSGKPHTRMRPTSCIFFIPTGARRTLLSWRLWPKPQSRTRIFI